jgi:predicted phage tail component-like protein
MRNGFTYKNQHSSDFGIVAKTKSRPILPEMKSYTFESPITDGIYDFSEANEYGRAFYNDRFFEIQLQVSADNLRSLEKKVSRIAKWLKGSGELVFDDMPNVKWRARVISEMGFVPELYGKKAVLTVVFRVEPFSYCFFDTIDGVTIDAQIPLEENLPINIEETMTVELVGGDSAYKSASADLTVVNIGDVAVRPIIRISGSVKNISLSCGGKTLSVNASAEGMLVDLDKQTVTDLDGESLMTSVSGEFFEIGEDNDEIAVSMYVKGTAQTAAEYVPQFVYDFDLENVDWGDDNA